MKNLLVFAALIAFLGCQEGQDNTQTHVNRLDKSVGQRIPYDVAIRWMDNLGSSAEGREGSFTISNSQLAQVLQASGKVGLAFHHAIDDNGVQHVLVLPVIADAELWSAPVVIDGNTDQAIDVNVAKAWADNYSNAYPDGIWFHFFGLDVMEEISQNPEFNYMDIAPALNDLGQPQLLLLVWNGSTSISGGRTSEDAATTDGKGGSDPIVYDFSNACPPC